MEWNLKNIYENDSKWEEDIKKCQNLIANIKSFKGKLNEKTELNNYLKNDKELDTLFDKIYSYAHLASDLNKKDNGLLSKVQRITTLFSKYSEESSFVTPELLTYNMNNLIDYLDDDNKEYKFIIEKSFRNKDHVLDEKSEGLLANFSSIPSGGDIYSSVAVGDSYSNDVILENDEKIKITEGNFTSYLSKLDNQNDRTKVFEAVFSKYKKLKNTFASIYMLTLKNDWAYAKTRGYNSSLESFLYGKNIPISVYTNLIEVAKENTIPLKRYINLRKKYFKLDTYKTYDRFLKMGRAEKEYTYEEAKNLFFESIKNIDPRLNNNLHRALEDGYVDVYEKDGKRSGAYSSGSSAIHPYILLNFQGTLNDVFTIAHEAGHSSHTLFASEAQKPALANYTIFVAEIASTFNEHLLLDYLVSKSDSKEEKIYLLQKAIDEIFATFYRQTLFANYEYIAHKMVENDESITEESLSQIMIDLYKEYYDIDITMEESKRYVWAYIPHLFYTPFYVYQYATSFAASLKIYENVKKDSKNYDKYISMLEAGGSKYSIDIVKMAGVDLTDKKAFEAVCNRLNELVTELENLIDLN